MFIFFVSLFSLSFGFTLYGLPAPLPSTITTPTLLSRDQDPGMGRTVNWSSFGKNYTTVFLSGSPCAPSSIAPGSSNGILWMAEGHALCPTPLAQRNAQDAGYGMVINAAFPILAVAAYYHVDTPYPNGIPVAMPGNFPNENTPFRSVVPLTLLIPSWTKRGLNITYQLDFPGVNALSYSFSDMNSSLSILAWILVSAGMVLMSICLVKFGMFFISAGRVRLDLPMIVLSFCFATGAFAVMIGIWGYIGCVTASDNNGTFFFEYWPWVTTMCAVLLVGLYFGEVASLTSAKAIPGFEKFLIPAIAVIAFFWAVNITMSFLKAYVADASFSSSFSYFYLAFVAFFDAIILTVSIWGGVRLLLSLRGANSSSVLMFIILEFVAVAIIVGLSLAFFAFRVTPLTAYPMITEMGYYMASLAFCLCGPTLSSIIVSLMFRVSVSKEIEISKSATSSTIGASSMASSSKSSSHGDDPVIEL